jgi:ABC-type multidrug transport system permease subunit
MAASLESILKTIYQQSNYREKLQYFAVGCTHGCILELHSWAVGAGAVFSLFSFALLLLTLLCCYYFPCGMLYYVQKNDECDLWLANYIHI